MYVSGQYTQSEEYLHKQHIRYSCVKATVCCVVLYNTAHYISKHFLSLAHTKCTQLGQGLEEGVSNRNEVPHAGKNQMRNEDIWKEAGVCKLQERIDPGKLKLI